MTLAEQIERLTTLSAAQLKSEWRRVYKAAPPAAYTSDLLMRGIAYRIQEKALGGLPIELRRELDDRASFGGLKSKPMKNGQTVKLNAGNRLVRRWRGTTYAVMVERPGSCSKVAATPHSAPSLARSPAPAGPGPGSSA